VQDADRIATRGSEFWSEGTHVCGKTLPDAPHGTIDDAVAALDAIRTLGNGKKVRLLFDARNVSRNDPETRNYAIEHAPEIIYTAAVVINSRILRAASWFFVGLRKPPFPIRFFTTVESAEAWLLGGQLGD